MTTRNMEDADVELALSLCHLPDIVLEKIFSFLSYDEIAKKRQVCQRFNKICGKLLNDGYYRAEQYHLRCLKLVKSQLPRRESERRNHPLSKHSDILSGIETRISMLSMTFRKFISNGLCCFIPGKVIDEIFRILQHMDTYQNDSSPRTFEILQELRDISSMAMEHFDEKIVPILQDNWENNVCSLAGPSRKLQNFQQQNVISKKYESRKLDTLLKTQYKCKRETTKQGRIINELKAKVAAQEVQINELKQQQEEWDRRLVELHAKIKWINNKNPALLEASKVAASQLNGCKRKSSAIGNSDNPCDDVTCTKKKKDCSSEEDCD